jgi:hypothetical protein
MSRIMNSSALPSAMEQKLRQIRWRQSLQASVRGVAIGASVLIVAMVAVQHRRSNQFDRRFIGTGSWSPSCRRRPAVARCVADFSRRV